jgi:hypothetical protein
MSVYVALEMNYDVQQLHAIYFCHGVSDTGLSARHPMAKCRSADAFGL